MSQTQTYQVRGMTCGHCAGAVTNELKALDTVTGVTVDVVPQSDSTVTVTSSAGLETGAVRDAITRAGYELVVTSAG
ncbi:MAG TPA: heavy-metal-associated domain-containing protein [Mycobacterium sp.]|uniref:heavy-metal-associated domain-containing protein n=1 Tax=Mycolicibacterium sp. TaxID=2320850 RepID=UPI0025E2F7ED|nr:heavy-metal-associated domain-containing protein [Mycolicibacterium sp.]HPX38699.1 heavy-metal-associated domain-containing protein [Mycobacterium sp.]HQC76019.1 heavy-metal-associated domain-containing protein [Mycobacterium sp.]